MEYISFIAIIAKKIPKHFFKIPTSMRMDILAPIMAPKIPNIDIIMASFKSMFLFFKLTIMATTAVGIKKIRLVAWAICWSIPSKRERRKIKIVPPPIPVPLTIPATKPINISVIVFSYFLSKFYTTCKLMLVMLYLISKLSLNLFLLRR